VIAATAYTDFFVSWLAGAIARYETVELRGLGTFDVSKKPACPANFDKSKIVPAHRTVRFRPGQALKEALKKPLTVDDELGNIPETRDRE
jgi:nucleoid DNA-binding protein